MALFPGALPAAGTASASATLAAAGHTSLHNTDRDEIRALAGKVGTGASVSTAGLVLRGNGAGSSAWGQVVLTTDVTGVLPVANGGIGQNSLTGLPLVSPILTTPVIADFSGAAHNHQNAAGGGTLNGGLAIQADTITSNVMLGVDVWSYSSAEVGSPPTAGSGQFYLQAGTNVVAVDGNGNGSFNYPTSFPNGVISVVVSDGDTNIGAISAATIHNFMTASLCEIHSSKVSGNVRISWIAIGF